MAGEITSGWLTKEDLTDPEKALVDAALAHRWWPPPPEHPEEVTEPPQDADWGEERTIRAQVLYQLLTGKGKPSADGSDWDVAPRAVRVRGARIVERLDLAAATLRCPLELVGCWLDDAAPVLRDATAPAISLYGCWLPAGLDATLLTTRGDVDIRRCRVQGEVSLVGGRIGGQLGFDGGKFRNAGRAIDADRLRVDMGVFAGKGFEADGETWLRGGHFGGQLVLSGGKFRNAGGSALVASGLQVDQDLLCDGFEVDGTVNLLGAQIAGQLNLSGGKIRNTSGDALNAHELHVGGDVFCTEGFEADGLVDLGGGHVGGHLRLTGGTFRNTAGATALRLDDLQVNGNVNCLLGFEADGPVTLHGAHVAGNLDLFGGWFRSAIEADRIQVDGNLNWRPVDVLGIGSFRFGSVGVWSDSPEVLRIRLDLHGLRYGGLDAMPPEVTAAQRVAWLGLSWRYSPQPYSQLAAVYRAEGHDRAARQVLVASQARRRRQHSGWYGRIERAWSGLLRATVGYGYRPWLALLWLMALVVSGAFAVDALPEADFVASSGAPAFNSLLYAVDVLLPFIDLGYSKWVAVGVAQAVTVVLVVLGWVLATAVIAAFAGVLRRGD